MKKIALIAPLLALVVVVFGAYVRLSDAGLGCPDWPGCYGTLTVPESESAIQSAQSAYPNSPVDTGKAWKEMIHRYLASGLGFLIVGLFALNWLEKTKKVPTWLTSTLLGLVLLQGALGMWTVTLLLRPAIVSAHLMGGMTILATLTYIASQYWAGVQRIFITHAVWYRVGLLVLFGQIFLGGWTSSNYAALACTDFPTCHGAWIPEMDFSNAYHMFRELGQDATGGQLGLSALTAIQWIHRIGAMITFIYLGLLGLNGLKYTQIRFLSIALLGVLCSQVVIGIGNLVLHLPTVLAVAHNAGAALLVILMVFINAKISNKQ